MMARWNAGSFDDGEAVAWADSLEHRGIEAIADAFHTVVEAGDRHLDVATGATAIAAAEVIARWRHGTTTGHQPVDRWLASVGGHPPADVVEAARRTVERVAGPRSALAGLRDGDPEWRSVVDTLTTWLTTTELASQGTVPAGPVGISPNAYPDESARSTDERGMTRRDRAMLMALRTAGVDLTRRRAVVHHLFFLDAIDAAAACDEATAVGWVVEVHPPDKKLAAWSVTAMREDVMIDPVHIRTSSAFFDRLADVHHGLNDGWEAPDPEESD